jgi:hypothetical protein
MEKIFKSVVLFLGVLFFRLIPVRPPNVEPLLAVIMPFSKKFNLLISNTFIILSIFVYDFLTAGIGSYTYSVALSYVIIGLFAYKFFENRKGSIKDYALFSVGSILFFDCLTGLVVGPLALGQSFSVALIGQIPFTLLHLMGGVMFSIILSPLVAKFLETDLEGELFQKMKR